MTANAGPVAHHMAPAFLIALSGAVVKSYHHFIACRGAAVSTFAARKGAFYRHWGQRVECKSADPGSQVRGYNVGELAACRSFLEGAAELRVPVLGKTVYAFYEYGTDLGSSKLVKGNPTEYYRRAGRCGLIFSGVYLLTCACRIGALRLLWCFSRAW